MLVVYLTTLIAGGFFVGLSLLGGDGDSDAALDDGAMELAGEADVDLAAPSGASLSDASHGGHRGRKSRFIPFLSFRFWTFCSTFFGLTGSALTTLTGSEEPFTLAVSGAMGIACGLAVSALVHALRTPVSSGASSLSDYVGRVGPLLVPLKPGGTSKMRLRLEQKDIDMLVTTASEREIPKGAQVVILGFDEDGRARIALEQSLFLEKIE